MYRGLTQGPLVERRWTWPGWSPREGRKRPGGRCAAAHGLRGRGGSYAGRGRRGPWRRQSPSKPPTDELAERQAYLAHRKDRQEVLERHWANARAAIRAMPGNVRTRVRLRAEGLLLGLNRLRTERLEREFAERHPTARERAATRAKRHREYVEIREEIADLERRLFENEEEEEEAARSSSWICRRVLLDDVTKTTTRTVGGRLEVRRGCANRAGGPAGSPFQIEV